MSFRLVAAYAAMNQERYIPGVLPFVPLSIYFRIVLTSSALRTVSTELRVAYDTLLRLDFVRRALE